jgi:hypothetical protein
MSVHLETNTTLLVTQKQIKYEPSIKQLEVKINCTSLFIELLNVFKMLKNEFEHRA